MRGHRLSQIRCEYEDYECEGDGFVAILNLYTPDVGSMPPVLAGRENVLNDAYDYLENVQNGYPQQPVIYFGLRGVGKTVLLNDFELAANNRNMLAAYIEASEDGKFTARLIASLVRLTNGVSAKTAASDFAKRSLSLIKSFRLTYNIRSENMSFDLNPDANESIGVYTDDITEIFVSLGQAAKQAQASVCIFVDEMQYLSAEEIAGLTAALHRCNQLRLPITMFGAGLPRIKKAVGDARSYAERLYKFEEISALSKEGAFHAIADPAKNLGVEYDDDAVERIIEITKGYPYYIQTFCDIVWKQNDGNRITLTDISSAEESFFHSLDIGFFSVRYDKCSNMEKSFMAAMVKCGNLPCTISNVAMIMNRSVKAISPFRGKLINKGLIYATGHAGIDFTVPQFDGFIRRRNPNLQV